MAAPIEVVWSRLIALVDEMAVSLKRMSFSTILRESNDYAVVLTDQKGGAIVHNTMGMPSFIGALARAVKGIVQKYPPDNLSPGDVLITNDPWLTSGHLPDITVVTPVFLENRVAAFSVSICHATDVGGRLWSADATELYEEGMQIPLMKLYRGGNLDRSFVELLSANVRMPEQFMGDIHAQVNSNALIQRRLPNLVEELEIDDFDKLCEEIYGRSEAAMRTQISALPSGSYQAEVLTDGFDRPDRIRLRLTVENSDIVADFTGTSPQIKRGINVVYNYTFSWTMFALKAMLAPELSLNEGYLRPVDIRVPEGSILNARYPAPVGSRHLTGRNAAFAVFLAFSEFAPERTMSVSCQSGYPFFGGVDRRGRRFTQFLPMCGGMGARYSKDGPSATFFPSNASNVPIELVEALTPLRFECKELVRDSGGPGKYRGGLAQRTSIVAETDMKVSIVTDQVDHPPFGLFGGHAGSPRVNAINGDTNIHAKGQFLLEKGDRVLTQQAGGGGLGIPFERDPQAVLRDVREGLVSAEAANSIYGVAIDLREGTVDVSPRNRDRGEDEATVP
jgi:N-methylhydantoinase B